MLILSHVRRHIWYRSAILKKIGVPCNKLMQMWDGTFWFCRKWSSTFSFGLSFSCFPRSNFFNFYWNHLACCTIRRGIHIYCCRRRVDMSIQTRKQPNTWRARNGSGIVVLDRIICSGFLNGVVGLVSVLMDFEIHRYFRWILNPAGLFFRFCELRIQQRNPFTKISLD